MDVYSSHGFNLPVMPQSHGRESKIRPANVTWLTTQPVCELCLMNDLLDSCMNVRVILAVIAATGSPGKYYTALQITRGPLVNVSHP
ncbi:hypothetical protein J6590_019124 [Homalodisca vitripennis]|nr:hypothetical protein J6590_019124 [Homalodisca vitripennis]